MIKKRKGMLIAVAAITALGTGGVAIAGATGGGEDPERAITGAALERASASALAETGGGKVTDTEAGDEDGAYEVEVTLGDGREVDVHLDKAFRVLGSEAEGDGAEEPGEAGEDRSEGGVPLSEG